jgi:hypothetical protein
MITTRTTIFYHTILTTAILYFGNTINQNADLNSDLFVSNIFTTRDTTKSKDSVIQYLKILSQKEASNTVRNTYQRDAYEKRSSFYKHDRSYSSDTNSAENDNYFDKGEFSLRLKDELINFERFNKVISSDIVTDSDLLEYKEMFFYKAGKTYFNVFESKTYYDCTNRVCKPIYNPKMPLESFVDLFLTNVSASTASSLNVTHHIYPNQKFTYNLTLAKFLQFMTPSHELYFAIEKFDSSVISGVLILKDKNRPYFHLLLADASIVNMFNINGHQLQCKLYSYIPTDNIKNIFAEK